MNKTITLTQEEIDSLNEVLNNYLTLDELNMLFPNHEEFFIKLNGDNVNN